MLKNRAYQKLILHLAQDNLGEFFDLGVNHSRKSLEEMIHILLASGIGKEFANGNRTYITGMTGSELLCEGLFDVNMIRNKCPEISKIPNSYSKEYWTGFILAYFQWYTNKSFDEINQKLQINRIREMYNPYHETSEEKFCEDMLVKYFNDESNLKIIRKRNNLTQLELSERANVPVRNIRTYEQKPDLINNAKAITLFNLSKALNCNMEDLVE